MTTNNISKYRLSRRSKKLQTFDDQRVLVALPKDVSERTWAEILQKEENDLFLFDVREEILEEAMRVGYERYMEKQTAFFTSHCAAKAWLKLIDWHFYRHDPGEEPSAYPPAYIPKRNESWMADEPPRPSPKDTWSHQELVVVEETCEQGLRKWLSNESIEFAAVEEIEEEYWFPGKVYFPEGSETAELSVDSIEVSSKVSENLAAESEVLQNVTDYTTDEIDISLKSSIVSALKPNSPFESSLRGAGDSMAMDKGRSKNNKSILSRIYSTRSSHRAGLPRLSTESFNSVISDCRLRHLSPRCLDHSMATATEMAATEPCLQPVAWRAGGIAEMISVEIDTNFDISDRDMSGTHGGADKTSRVHIYEEK